MPIEVSWLNDDQSVILLVFPQRWTWREFHDAKMTADGMMDMVEHDCALILTGPPNVVMPENVLTNARAMIDQKHPRAQVLVIVAPNRFVHALVNMLLRLSSEASRSARIVASMEAAQVKLMQMGFLHEEKIL
jgi:hypothetical protein